MVTTGRVRVERVTIRTNKAHCRKIKRRWIGKKTMRNDTGEMIKGMIA